MEQRKEGGVFGKVAIPFLPPRWETGEGGWRSSAAANPAVWALIAVGWRGKMERGGAGSDPQPRLGLG